MEKLPIKSTGERRIFSYQQYVNSVYHGVKHQPLTGINEKTQVVMFFMKGSEVTTWYKFYFREKSLLKQLPKNKQIDYEQGGTLLYRYKWSEIPYKWPYK